MSQGKREDILGYIFLIKKKKRKSEEGSGGEENIAILQENLNFYSTNF